VEVEEDVINETVSVKFGDSIKTRIDTDQVKALIDANQVTKIELVGETTQAEPTTIYEQLKQQALASNDLI
jgi:hypothetical protein